MFFLETVKTSFSTPIAQTEELLWPNQYGCHHLYLWWQMIYPVLRFRSVRWRDAYIEILDLECVLCHVTGVQNENKNALINPPSWIQNVMGRV